MMYYHTPATDAINQTTDGFLSSLLNDEDLHLMDMAMNDGKSVQCFLLYLHLRGNIQTIVSHVPLFNQLIANNNNINEFRCHLSFLDYYKRSIKINQCYRILKCR